MAALSFSCLLHAGRLEPRPVQHPFADPVAEQPDVDVGVLPVEEESRVAVVVEVGP